MKTGRTLTELAREIERQANAKQDYVAATKNMEMTLRGNDIGLEIGQNIRTGINGTAHSQIGEKLQIPAKYYAKMQESAPALLCTNVNEWFRQSDARQMVRVLDGNARAFVSDRFSVDMDNHAFAEAVLPVLFGLKLEVMSCQITESRLYIKAVDQKVYRELAKAGAHMGDGGHTIVRVVAPAITISNSEVGKGSLSVQGGVYDRFCSNLGSFGERSLRRAHLGGKHTVEEGELYAMLSDRTRKLDAAALWSKVRDVVRGVFDRAKFDSLVDKIEGTQGDKIESSDVVEVVKKVGNRLGLNDGEGQSVLKFLIEGGELSRFGVYNAITRMSQEVDDYDRATELERIGPQVIELPRSEWKKLAESAA